MIPRRTKIIGFILEVVTLVLLLVVPWPSMMGRTPISYQPWVGEPLVFAEAGPEHMSFRDHTKQIELESTAILYGDTLHIGIHNINQSDITISDFPFCAPSGLHAFVRLERYPLDIQGNITKMERRKPFTRSAGSYQSTFNVFQTVVRNDPVFETPVLRIDYKSGERLLFSNVQIPLPCLSDHPTPFWEQLSQDVRKKPIPLNFQFTFYETGRSSPVYYFETTIVIKPRPAKQMRLFSQWSESVSAMNNRLRTGESAVILQPNQSEVTEPSGQYHHQPLWVSLPHYPGYYLDVDLIKSVYPPSEYTPKTVNGWRRLEESLSPGTLRDEIHLNRLRFEYYLFTGVEEQIAAHQIEYFLSQLPPARAAVMVLGINPYYCDKYLMQNTQSDLTTSKTCDFEEYSIDESSTDIPEIREILRKKHIDLLKRTKKYQLYQYEGLSDERLENIFREKKILCF